MNYVKLIGVTKVEKMNLTILPLIKLTILFSPEQCRPSTGQKFFRLSSFIIREGQSRAWRRRLEQKVNRESTCLVPFEFKNFVVIVKAQWVLICILYHYLSSKHPMLILQEPLQNRTFKSKPTKSSFN